MSATKFTASVTVANSSGRIVRNRKIGRSASLRTTYRSSRRVSSSAHWTSSMSSASGRMSGEREIATPARSKARRSLASGDRRLEAGLVAPGDGLDHAADRGLGRRPRGRVADRARGEQAARDEERPADLLVGGDRDAGEPGWPTASSAAASSRRVLPMPGSPSRVTAARRLVASRSSWAIASSSALRPMTAPVARRSWTASEHCGSTSGSSAPPSTARSGVPARRTSARPACPDYGAVASERRRGLLTGRPGAGRRTSRARGPPWPAVPSGRACTARRSGRRTRPRPAAAPP